MVLGLAVVLAIQTQGVGQVPPKGKADSPARQLCKQLLVAAWKDNLPKVRALVGRGANVNFRSDVFDGTDPHPVRRSTTALIMAAEGNLEMVRFLIHRGAYVNAIDSNGNTPLHQATNEGQVDIVRTLLRAGADWRIKNIYSYTPLMLSQRAEQPAVERGPVIKRILLAWAKDHGRRSRKSHGNR